MSEPIRLTLPYPPGGNNQRIVSRKLGRLISAPKYRAWQKLASDLLAIQKPGSLKGRYTILIEADRPDKRARDVANLEKCTSDILVKTGVLEDDSLAQSVTLQWRDDEPVRINPRLHITICAVP